VRGKPELEEAAMTQTSTGTTTVHINAPAEVLFDMITDVARMGEWSPECVGAEVPTALPIAPGVTFTGKNSRGGQEWSTVCTVIAAEHPTSFAFVAGDPETATTWTYELRALSDQATEVTESFDSAALRNPELATQLTGRHEQLLSDIATTLDTLKNVAEREDHR
jgi:uncharacterized protein YndB with AHSA1/START domain